MNYVQIFEKASQLVNEIEDTIHKLLAEDFCYECFYRIKSEEHALRKQKLKNFKKLEEVEDLIGFRILLENEEACHQVYERLLKKYHPYKVSDYFQHPKITRRKSFRI